MKIEAQIEVEEKTPEYARLLTNRREAKGITQKELAKMLLCSHMAISHYERGIRFPNITRFQKWCDLLGVEIVLKDK